MSDSTGCNTLGQSGAQPEFVAPMTVDSAHHVSYQPIKHEPTTSARQYGVYICDYGLQLFILIKLDPVHKIITFVWTLGRFYLLFGAILFIHWVGKTAHTSFQIIMHFYSALMPKVQSLCSRFDNCTV